MSWKIILYLRHLIHIIQCILNCIYFGDKMTPESNCFNIKKIFDNDMNMSISNLILHSVNLLFFLQNIIPFLSLSLSFFLSHKQTNIKTQTHTHFKLVSDFAKVLHKYNPILLNHMAIWLKWMPRLLKRKWFCELIAVVSDVSLAPASVICQHRHDNRVPTDLDL